MKISVCIPMYNESAIIADTAKTLVAALEDRFGEDYELLFSDDGSTDGSGTIVRDLQLPRVRVVGYEQNRGTGCAVRTAMLEAKGDYVLFTDADLAYGTDVIGRAVKTFEANPGSDLVIGSRNLGKDGYEGYTFLRKIASKTYIRKGRESSEKGRNIQKRKIKGGIHRKSRKKVGKSQKNFCKTPCNLRESVI